ncbi:hypothetical protein ACWCOZ_29485 [Streptomyces sp. NPDC001840]
MTTKGWCYFTVDSTRPKAPTVTTPAGAVYAVCPDDGDGCGAATGGPGIAGQFTFSKNSVDANIVAFEYKLATDKSWTKVSATSSLTRSVKPALSGVQVLYVRAVDSVGSGQSGETTAIRFNVAEGEGPSGLWHFNDFAPDSGGRLRQIRGRRRAAGTNSPCTRPVRAGRRRPGWAMRTDLCG